MITQHFFHLVFTACSHHRVGRIINVHSERISDQIKHSFDISFFFTFGIIEQFFLWFHLKEGIIKHQNDLYAQLYHFRAKLCNVESGQYGTVSKKPENREVTGFSKFSYNVQIFFSRNSTKILQSHYLVF